MGFRDRFNDLAKQAKETVAEHQEQIHEAVEQVSVAADEKTHGKYTAKIAKVGEKATAAVDKLSVDEPPAAAGEQASGDESAVNQEARRAPFSAEGEAPAGASPAFDDGSSANPPVFGFDPGRSDHDSGPESSAGV
jgi:hypothetical protein